MSNTYFLPDPPDDEEDNEQDPPMDEDWDNTTASEQGNAGEDTRDSCSPDYEADEK